MRSFFNKYRRVIIRILRDAALPVAAALVWGFVVGIQKQSKLDGISAASIAFFLVLSLQNQIFRVTKNVRDEERGEEVIDHLQSLRQSITELRALGLTPPAPVPVTPPNPVTAEPPPGYVHSIRPIPLGFNYFLQLAHDAVGAGQYFAGVLVAAVGFEYAARRGAEQIGIETDRKSLAQIVRELGHRTEDQRAIETLHALNRLRNSLVHAEQDGPWVDRQQALDLIGAFSIGAQYLEMAV